MKVSIFVHGVLLLALVPFTVQAQTPTISTTDPVAQLTAAINDLSQRMVTKEDLADLVTKTELQHEVDALTDLIVSQDAEIQKLKADYEEFKTLAYVQTADQQKILDAISQMDSAGNPTLAIRSNMNNSPDFRKEMSNAVHRSIRTQGVLTIDNTTASTQSMRVNGTQYQVSPLSELRLEVPIGTVTTELVGVEAPKNWTITAPDYKETVYINPTPTVVRRIVGSPAIVSPPIIYNPPPPIYYPPTVPVILPVYGW